MEQSVRCVLQRWQKSLELKGKIDARSLNKDYCILDKFIRTYNKRDLCKLVAICRDLSITHQGNSENLLVPIAKALTALNKRIERLYEVDLKRPSAGQRERYRAITKSIGKEKVRNCKGTRLRNLDITILDKKDSRMVRRIVEKRMCQEYHRQHKSHFHTTGNRSRQNMRRAVSYQLYNLGQLEGTHICRDYGTHWKWSFDENIQDWVLKKKIGYATEIEAINAAKEYGVHHDESLDVYQCAHCKKFHIGHPREESITITA